MKELEKDIARAKSWEEREAERKRVRDRMIRRAKLGRLLTWLIYAALFGWFAWLLIRDEMRESACEDTCNAVGNLRDVCFCAEEDGTVYLQAPDE